VKDFLEDWGRIIAGTLTGGVLLFSLLTACGSQAKADGKQGWVEMKGPEGCHIDQFVPHIYNSGAGSDQPDLIVCDNGTVYTWKDGSQ
jgi:hypothetical protein